MSNLLASLAVGCATLAALATPAAALELGLKPTAPAGDSPVVGSVADLTFNTSDLQSRLEIGVEAGRAADGAVDAYGAALSGERSKWSSGRLSLRQVWTPLDNARFELDAAGGARRDIDQTSRIGSGMGRQTGEASANFTGRYTPIRNLDLELSAGSSSRADESFSLATGSLGKDLSTRRSRQASAGVSFTPLPRLKLEGRSRMSAVDLAWSRSSLAVRGAYGFAEPQVAATLSLWDGASWRLGALRTVAAPSPDQFIRYADAFGAAAARNFRPDPEWRYETSLEQHIGAVALRTNLTLARQADLAALPAVRASQPVLEPGSAERRQVETTLAAPLNLPGLGALTVSARAAWRRSSVELPTTAQARLQPLSAYEANLSIGQAGDTLAWRMQARAGGASRTYQMGEVITQAGGGGLSGYLAYQPGPLRLQLSVESAFDGQRGRRGLGYLDTSYRIEKPRSVEHALRIQLIKAL